MTTSLCEPMQIGDLTLANRIVMAPLTRNRALPDGDLPHALTARYYAQRASAGLLITEGTQISPEGKGYAWTPGIYSAKQVAGWRLVTDAVHAQRGLIFAQLWHVGRVSTNSLQPNGQAPVGPSAIAASSRTFDGTGFVPTATPRALSTDEIARVVDDFRQAAENAKDAGFDGIELHGANGYLIDQFLRDGSNRRDDRYGGSIENRARLLAEVLEALTGVWPSHRVGVRFSPFSNANDVSDTNPMATFSHAVSVANRFKLGYLHLVEGQTGGSRELPPGAGLGTLRARFSGAYMANNGYDRAMAEDAVAAGTADLVAFGRPFIANPDLVERLRRNASLNTGDHTTYFGGDEKGYTDYPVLAGVHDA